MNPETYVQPLQCRVLACSTFPQYNLHEIKDERYLSQLPRTWCTALKEERRCKTFEKTVFWRTYGSTTYTKEKKKMQLQSGELDDTYSSPSDRIKKGKIVWTCSTYGKMSSYHEDMI